jgi:HEAT repeat protein
MRTTTILLATLALLLAAVGGPDARGDDEWAQALKAYKRDIRPDKPLRDRLGAVHALAYFGTRDAARILLDTVKDTERHERPLLEEKEEVEERIQKILGSKQFDSPRNLDARIMPGLKELQKKLDELQRKVVAEARVRQEISEDLSTFSDAKAVKYLFREALKDGSPRVRETAARALGGIGNKDAIMPLRRALADKKVAVREASLVSLGELEATEALPDILKALEDEAWPVRAAAVKALRLLAAKESVGPLIEAMSREEGRLQKDIADVLEDLTGQGFGVNVDGWRRWWEEHRGEYGGESGLGLGGKGPRGKVSYYGIETYSNRIVYVLDVSGSMASAHAAPGRAAQGKEISKVAAAKRELIRSLKSIPAKGFFTIIVYNDLIKVWQPKLVSTTPANKKKAVEFVTGLTAAQSTNIYGALEACFKLAGMGASDKRYDLGADTIFLLSDGSPTKADGSLDSTDKILFACREWNRLKRVTIHCIGIGKAHNGAFMRTLATENGGQYVAR